MKRYQLREEVELLRKYIRESIILIKEDTDSSGGYGDYLGDLYGGGGGGGGGGDGSPVFITAFTDVFKTASAETQKMIEKVKTFTNVSFQAAMSGINPFYKAEYGKLFQEEAAKISAIKSKYSDVYKRTFDAFKDNDFAWAAFICTPEAFLTKKFFDKTSETAQSLAGLFPGGNKILSSIKSESFKFTYLNLLLEVEKNEKEVDSNFQEEMRESVKDFLTGVLRKTSEWKKVSSMNIIQFETFLKQREGADPADVASVREELQQQKQNWLAKIEQEADSKEVSNAAKKVDDGEWAKEFLNSISNKIVKNVEDMLEKRISKAKEGGATDDCEWIGWHKQILGKI